MWGERITSQKAKNILESLGKSFSQAVASQDECEKLPYHIQDQCVDVLLGKSKSDHWKFAGTNARKPDARRETFDSSILEQQGSDGKIRELVVTQQEELSKYKELHAKQEKEIIKLKEKSKKKRDRDRELMLELFLDKRERIMALYQFIEWH